ncbi:MAG: aspartate aminotransferase family protein [Bacteroidales bacterium]|jgi:acetylornithine/succinyldiaminopimelate/putrescine aminotransferase|nr:aspartate aminotransferase family protein [Bacteroidales bacterium]
MRTHRQLFTQLLGQTSPAPLSLEVEYARGVYMYTPEGDNVIDIISGVSASNLGHSHPKIVSAVKEQAEKYMHLMVYGEIIQSPQVQLAECVLSLLPESISSLFLVNSGSEAVEGALKLAKRVTGRPKIISTHNAYHGSTHGALSVLGNDYFKNNYQPLLPDVHFINYNNTKDLEEIDANTACVIIEPIQSEAGIIIGDTSYLQALREKCTETGTLLIFDEVQNGFGRTGKMFGHEHSGVVPDIICFAKGLGGGMPIGAFAASKEHMDNFTHNPVLGHITTFGGHPVSSAAALACVHELVENSSIIDDIPQKEKLFRELLLSHPKVQSIRGKGLFMAVELDSKESVQKLIQTALKNGVLTDYFLFCETHFRIAPPLIITENEIREACTRLHKALDEL